MDAMKASGEFAVTPEQFATARQTFTAARVDDAQTLATIRAVYETYGYILDPHSAVGVAAAQALAQDLPEPVVALACAHPAKFPETIQRAIGLTPPLPPAVAALLQKPERTALLSAESSAVLRFIEGNGRG